MKPVFRILLTAVFALTLLLSAVASPTGAAATAAAPAGDVVRIYFADRAELAELANFIDIWEVNHAEGYLVTWASPAGQADLTARGYTVKVDAEHTARFLASLPVAVAGQTEGIPSYPCYRTVEETYAALETMAENYDELVTLTDIGDSWDKATDNGPAGYDLWEMTLTNEAFTPAGGKFRFFLMAEIHAREYVTAETATRLAEYLLANYGADPDITWLLDYGELHLVPMTNPDGRKFAEEGYSYRKNTDNDDGGICDVPPTGWSQYGTDLNRNADYKWGDDSEDPCDLTFQGPFAGSEPEVQTLQNYVESIFADERDENNDNDPAPDDYQGLFITLHSYSNLVLFPYGWASSNAPNHTDLQTLARKMAYFNSYTPEKSSDLYPASGCTDDWAYGTLGVPGFTYEMGNNGFFQACPFYDSTMWPQNRNALLWSFRLARRPYQNAAGPDTITLAASPASATVGTPVTLTATANDTRFNNSNGTEPTQNIQAAHYSIDEPAWAADAVTYPMAAADGTFNAKTENLTATIDTTDLAPGRHTLFIESQDVAGNWGVTSAVFFYLNPPVYAMADLTPETATAFGLPGETVTHTLTLTNIGETTDTFNLSLASAPTWTTQLLPSSVSLAPDASTSVTVTVQIPAGAPAGATDPISLIAMPSANPTGGDNSELTTGVQPLWTLHLPLVLR
ncbi:MAG TPA: M14 family zinc carboxypeptidase [Anaerolineaceae bacterium]|nr:M14 family zinc carboxypeptidase [Anaerolineaceae bacterium]